MATTTRFPRTNEELYELGGGQPVRFPGTEEEYWALLEEAEYRVDFYNHEIIASISYESDEHSAITSRINFLLHTIFQNRAKTRIHNSNRPVCIPFCNNAVFNPDGSVIQLPGEKYEYRPGMTAELTPIVLFEVLSLSTRVRDWGEKLPCYKQIPSLQQILYVDGERLSIHFMERLDENGKWLESAYNEPENSFKIGNFSINPLRLSSLRDLNRHEPHLPGPDSPGNGLSSLRDLYLLNIIWKIRQGARMRPRVQKIF